MRQDNFAEQITGVAPPRSFVMDASVLDYQEEYQIIREDVKQNRVVFSFPSGVNKLDLLEECRALTALDDFDMMFDITMQMLVDKDLVISIRNEAGVLVEMASIHVTDRYQNLRGCDFIDEYPVVVTWLIDFMGASLLKKFPVPGPAQSAQSQTPQKKGAAKRKLIYQG
jgi:hypothetical protein